MFRTSTLLATATASAALVAAAPAQAAAPAVTTGGASRVTPTSATLTGAVDPQGRQTTYRFELGPTRAYGTSTAPVAAGNADNRLVATGDAGSLTPATTYHYRLVATNGSGTARGADRTFKTQAQPLGLTLAATPNVVLPGQPLVLSGTLAGTDNANRKIAIQQTPFPFTAPFGPLGNQLVTDAAGNFSLPVLSLPITTELRVVVAGREDIASPPITVGLAVRVSTSVTRTRVRRGRSIRFSGTIRPARVGVPVQVQKLTSTGRWTVVGTATARTRTADYAVYGKTVKVPRGGSYRIFVASAGDVVANAGRTVKVTSFR